MHSIRSILSTTLLLALLSPVLTHPSDQQSRSQEADKDAESFQKLLDQVDSPSLHAALHDYSPKKFQHGMFQEDKNAVKAIHSSEPKAARKIIELAKRQDGGISNSSTPATSSLATPVPPISQGSTLGSVFPPPSTTSAVASSASSTGFSSSPTLTSFGVTNTSTAASSSSTNSESSKKATSSGSVTHGSITSTAIHVTTLPNGSQSTVTAITVVPAGNGAGATPTGEAGAGSETGKSPSLQTGEAVMSRSFGREGMAVLVGALGFAAMM